MTVTEPEPISRTAAISSAIDLPLALIAVVFLPVGRLNWPPGWFFIGFLVVIYGTAALTLAWVNTAIYWARSRNRPGMERWERILLLLMLPAVIVEIPDPTQSSATQAMSVRS
jgi:predicted Abi (CAAX) family protease